MRTPRLLLFSFIALMLILPACAGTTVTQTVLTTVTTTQPAAQVTTTITHIPGTTAPASPATTAATSPPVTTTAATTPATVTTAALTTATTTRPVTTPVGEMPMTAVIASGLEVPWSLAFLPDGAIIFTERTGRVRLIQADGALAAQPLLTISEVSAQGEGGLLGIALHPDFNRNKYVYLYYTYSSGGPKNKVVRYTLDGQRLASPREIITDIPGGTNHNGGRIKFGPDGYLYVTCGETFNRQLAQQTDNLAGKILRLTDDGGIPPDNPFPGSSIYSYGNRNPQGLAWDSQGRLWATEHGPSGELGSGQDEVNIIEKGKNYGWPAIRGNMTTTGMESPVIHSGADTWAPSGMVYLDGYVYFAGLRGNALYRVNTTGTPKLETFLKGQFGRLRDVMVGLDGMLYVSTNNRDGRGSPVSADDRIIRVNPSRLG